MRGGARVGTGVRRRTTTSAATRTGVAAHVQAAVARELARDPEDRTTDEVVDHPLDPDDAPADADVPELPRDDGEDRDGDALPLDLPAGSLRRLPPQLSLYLGASGSRQHLVRTADPERLGDPALAALVQARTARLELLGQTLTGAVPPAVLRATTLAAAFAALPVWAAKDFATWAGLGEPEVSTEADVVVGLPAGRVPLQFFFWRKASDDLADRLAEWPGLSDLGRGAAGRARRELDLAVSEDSVRFALPWVQAAVRNPGIARGVRARLAQSPERSDRLRARYVALLQAEHRASTGETLDLRRRTVVENWGIMREWS